MKIFNFFKKEQNQDDSTAEITTEANYDASAEVEMEEEVNSGTKIKVLAALMIVGFATYVAYWVQSPTDYKADVFNATQQTDQNSQSQSQSQADSQASEQSGFTQQVSIADFAFSPSQINVAKNTTVIWTNKDSVPHTVTSTNFSSPTLNAGDTFSYTFADDATVNYNCTFHPQMKGTIVVGTGGSVDTQAQTQSQTQGDLTEAALTQTEQLYPAAVETPPVDQNTQALALNEVPTEQTLQSLPVDNHAAAYDYQDSAAIQAAALEAAKAQMEAAQALADQQASQVKYKGKLAKSGPEDILYFAAFGLILYFNRKKLLSSLK